MPTPTVLITIGLYKAVKYLPDLLPCLEKIDYPKDRYKIFFTDDVSPDETVSKVQEFLNNLPASEREQYILQINTVNGGFCGNYNRGMNYGVEHGFDYVYILNQDTTVPPDFLSRVVETAERHPEAAIIQSKILYNSDHNKINSWGNELHYLGFGFTGGNLEKDLDLPEKYIPIASGCGVLFRREFLTTSGSFAVELYMYSEDYYIGLLARIQGKEIILSPRSHVYHKYNFVSSTDRIDLLERNRFLILLWFLKWKTLFLILPAFLFMECGQIYFSFVRGWWRKRFSAYGFFLYPANWHKIIERRRFVQQFRKINDRQLTSWLSGTVMYQEIKTWLLEYVANPIFGVYWKLARLILWW